MAENEPRARRTQNVDQEARDLARQALSMIQTHEARCDERWEGARQQMTNLASATTTSLTEIKVAHAASMSEFKGSVKEVWARIWMMVGGTVAALLTIISFLAVKAFG